MQFELSARDLDQAGLVTTLHSLDSNARIVVDAAHNRLEVISTATVAQLQNALQRIGYVAKPLATEVHISGASTCCGHCA
ncbi:MAG: hypothetical protein ABI538_05230 [Pseudoxanthomonas sp.]